MVIEVSREILKLVEGFAGISRGRALA